MGGVDLTGIYRRRSFKKQDESWVSVRLTPVTCGTRQVNINSARPFMQQAHIYLQ